MRHLIGKQAKRFAKREDGTATIEAVLWFPFFIAAFGFVLDATMVLHNHSTMMRVIQDANRAFAIGRLVDENATETFVENALSSMSANAKASTALVDGVIFTSVAVPASDLQIIGVFNAFSNTTIRVRAQHLFEE